MKKKYQNIQAILFDKDGTLIDFNQTWKNISFALALRAASGDTAKARLLLQAGGFDFEADCFQPESVIAAGTLEDIVSLWHPELKEKGYSAEITFYKQYCSDQMKNTIVPIDGMKESLITLQSMGYKLGIATNDSRDSVIVAMQLLGCESLIDEYLGYDSVFNAKPAGDQIIAFADKMSLHSSEIAMVGDNLHDILAARNAQAGLAIAVLSGTGNAECLRQMSDILLPSIRELPDFFNGIYLS
ncbi:HAD family hydrolase [Bartonella tamiae]|uniref:phosphoglycolate phosphatase n=1 Tax=Bartonella tamiae Th239 TaxID=1094558 RepID=J0QTK4_9HYPH|nr:HAD family hydrolase [Bartonella tamiae]EJF89241.1 HAD hydrolase, family IA [Bartonella tamiae Th239]EJF95355.1 HAD hydrolase, family IA [Bartonella tamiae Th307]